MRAVPLDQLLPKDVADRLLAFKQDVMQALPGAIEDVILFGSRARGDAQGDSDYDLAVLLSGGLADDGDACRRIWDVAWNHLNEDVFIQAVPVSADAFRPHVPNWRCALRRTAFPSGEWARPRIAGLGNGVALAERGGAVAADSSTSRGDALRLLRNVSRRSRHARQSRRRERADHAQNGGQPIRVSCQQTDDAALTEAGRMLATGLQRRLRSDYDTDHVVPPADAAHAVKEARRFLETCAWLHGFPPP